MQNIFIFQKVMVHYENQALLKSYIAEWRIFFAQSQYLPGPFIHFENFINDSLPKIPVDMNYMNYITVRKVKYLVYNLYT